MITEQYLEKILVILPNIREACVIAASKEDEDYRFHAFITLADYNPEMAYAIQTEVMELLEGLKVRVEVLPELPKSALGRISRDALRSLCAEVSI